MGGIGLSREPWSNPLLQVEERILSWERVLYSWHSVCIIISMKNWFSLDWFFVLFDLYSEQVSLSLASTIRLTCFLLFINMDIYHNKYIQCFLLFDTTISKLITLDSMWCVHIQLIAVFYTIFKRCRHYDRRHILLLFLTHFHPYNSLDPSNIAYFTVMK